MSQKMDRMDRVEIIYAHMLAHLGEEEVWVDSKSFLEALSVLDARGWKFLPPPDHHYSKNPEPLILPIQDLRHLKPLN